MRFVRAAALALAAAAVAWGDTPIPPEFTGNWTGSIAQT